MNVMVATCRSSSLEDLVLELVAVNPGARCVLDVHYGRYRTDDDNSLESEPMFKITSLLTHQ